MITTFSLPQAKKALETCSAIVDVLSDNQKWIIWSFEHQSWWKPHACGYTVSLAEAGQYTFKEALDIVFNANRQGFPEEMMCPDFRKGK